MPTGFPADLGEIMDFTLKRIFLAFLVAGLGTLALGHICEYGASVTRAVSAERSKS